MSNEDEKKSANEGQSVNQAKESDKRHSDSENASKKYTRNRIFFGAPGTGKSFKLNDECKQILGENNKANYERVTFHPDYSYANFVGTYKPVMVDDGASFILDNENKREIAAIFRDQSLKPGEKFDLLCKKKFFYYDQRKEDEIKDILNNKDNKNIDELCELLCQKLMAYEDERKLAIKILQRDISAQDKYTALRNNTGVTSSRLEALIAACTDDNFNAEHTNCKNIGRVLKGYMKLRADEENKITYEYVPGPFMRALVKAMRNKSDAYVLIIEEINRANVAAVFGDIFQLLDRDDKGKSEYPIQASEDIKKYLAKELGGEPYKYSMLSIPGNMYIWATMNSADQGVFPMDTAFKRRWDFEYIGIDDAAADEKEYPDKQYTLRISGNKKYLVKWNKLRMAINDILSSEPYNVNEDKLLGPYFISKFILDSEKEEDFANAFKNKVLMYLFEDAVRHKRNQFFANCKVADRGSIRYSDVLKSFEDKGVSIFPFSKDTVDTLITEVQEEKSPQESKEDKDATNAQ